MEGTPLGVLFSVKFALRRVKLLRSEIRFAGEIFASQMVGCEFHFTLCEAQNFTIYEVNYFTFCASKIFHKKRFFDKTNSNRRKYGVADASLTKLNNVIH